MRRRQGFSLIITRRTLTLCIIILVLGASIMWGPRVVDKLRRFMYGVKPGVTLDNYPVGGLLEHELYDVIASLAEGYYVEVNLGTGRRCR